MMNAWLIPLFCAHVLGDFLLQPDWMCGENKKRLTFLLLHAALHGILAYLLVQQWGQWRVAVVIFLGHGWIDLVKSRCGQGSRAFVADQIAHVVLLMGVAGLLSFEASPSFQGRNYMILVAGLVSAVWGAGYFIRTIADKLTKENKGLEEALGKGLKNGGALIGKVERALIFLLVFMGQPAGVGFLIAAKSIIRFEEAKKQPLAEYVLIGTLWSFGLAMAVATFTRNLL
jgi:hypothetical protein